MLWRPEAHSPCCHPTALLLRGLDEHLKRPQHRQVTMSQHRFLLAALATIGLVGASAPASALNLTGDQLLADCQSPLDAQQGVCEGFIGGTTDGLAISMSHAKACWFKIPSDVDTGQLVSAIVRFLQVHPKERDQTAATLTLQALRETFPC